MHIVALLAVLAQILRRVRSISMTKLGYLQIARGQSP